MKIYKPKFWDKKFSIFAILFLPITILVLSIVFIKKLFSNQRDFKIPIICVGNIYLGGTGKTPLALFLAKEIKNIGKDPAIIRKFYPVHKDEHDYIKNSFRNLILRNNRTKAIEDALSKKFDTIILDDGFQDYEIKKDVNIICFNQNQLIGNGFVFPSGPLREGLNSIKNAEIVLINGKKDLKFERKITEIKKDITIYYSNYRPMNLDEFKNKKYLAFAGIGSPDNFFKLLEQNEITVIKKLFFPDHYSFKKKELLEIISLAKENNCEIITTEKDYFRIKDYNLNEIKYLKIDLEIIEKEKFLKNIFKIYDKNL